MSHRSNDYHHFDHETDADKMSLDGTDIDGSSYGSEAADEMFDDDVGDVTDEEDWASVGAVALRAGSFPKGRRGMPHRGKPIDYNAMARSESSSYPRGGGPARSLLAKSTPSSGAKEVVLHEQDLKLMGGVNEDEGEAVRALLSLGSV